MTFAPGRSLAVTTVTSSHGTLGSKWIARILPRGTLLRGGDCFVHDEGRTVIVVVELPEPVFVIVPHTPQEWGLFAYHIGNRHQPLMITERGIVCPDEPGVGQLLEQQQIPYTRETLPFTPATGAARHHHD